MDHTLEPRTPGPPADRFALLCIGLGLAASTVLALLSDGSYHHDAVSHYLYARWAWNSGSCLLDEWGRPGLTWLLFPLAPLGWTACRIESAMLSAASAGMAYGVARRLRWPRAHWVPLLCFVQPLFLLMSYTTLTETAVAFYLTFAVWCFVAGRPVCSAAILSLCFVTRYETLVFLPLWAVAIWRSGGPRLCYPLLVWAPLLHNVLGRVVLGRWPAAFILESQHPSLYGTGTPLSMAVKSMAASGPAVAVLALVGSFVLLRPGSRPRPRAVWLIPACYLGHLLAHTIIFWRGLYGSGGYPRFLVSTSPLAALCALPALGALLDPSADRRRRALGALAAVILLMWIGLELEAGIMDEAWLFLIDPMRWIVRGLAVLALLSVAGLWKSQTRLPGGVLAAAAIATTVLPLAYLIRPHRIPSHIRDVEQAVAWLRSSPHAHAPVIATTIWASYYLDRGFNVVPPDSTTILDDAPPGTVFIWDHDYSPTPRFDISAESMADRPAWRLLWQSPPRNGQDAFAQVYVRD